MKTVLITGASRGIGMATAVALGRAGFQVAATMRDPSRSQELARIVERERLPIRTWSMDVDQDDSVSKTIASIREQSGPIDVLVNNAGIESRGAIEELDISRFRAVMETNYFGPLRGIKAVLPSMRERRTGLHHQHHVGCREISLCAVRSVYGVEVRPWKHSAKFWPRK
jgi:NAD(P)-dependent dehydrogenase (short-subunit alcohol dehydrogenase family)